MLHFEGSWDVLFRFVWFGPNPGLQNVILRDAKICLSKNKQVGVACCKFQLHENRNTVAHSFLTKFQRCRADPRELIRATNQKNKLCGHGNGIISGNVDVNCAPLAGRRTGKRWQILCRVGQGQRPLGPGPRVSCTHRKGLERRLCPSLALALCFIHQHRLSRRWQPCAHPTTSPHLLGLPSFKLSALARAA